MRPIDADALYDAVDQLEKETAMREGWMETCDGINKVKTLILAAKTIGLENAKAMKQPDISELKTVDSRFAALLGEKRLKISDVSRKTGISRTTLTNLYYGRGRAISYAVIEKICTALDCGVSDILGLNAEVTSND